MTDEEINAIIAQAATDNPAVRMATTTVTSEESIADANAAFLEALGEPSEEVPIALATEPDSSETLITASAIETATTEISNAGIPNNTVVRLEQVEQYENAQEVKGDEIIPRNSDSILVDEETSRFSDAVWYNKIQEKVVILAGLGGIGSYVAFLLSRMKPLSLYLYDDDSVEAANMSGQLYSKKDIGKKKVNAMNSMVANYADYYSIFSISEKFTEVSEAADIMICGFDNMEARNLYFNKWRAHVLNKPLEDRKNCLFIDGRLAAESFQVFCITGDSNYYIDEYKNKWLFSDEQADATVCSYKQTTFCANMIGSVIVNLFVNFCANECNPIIQRDLPFMSSYEADTMYFKTVN